MLNLKDYDIQEKVYENGSKILYRGYSSGNGKAVIIKVLKEESTSSADVSRLYYEYEITRKLSTKSIMKPIGLEKAGNSLALIIECDGEISLREYIEGLPLNVESFLDISIKLTQSLGDIHYCGIVHRNITPDNIFIDPKIKEVRITDFSYAVLYDTDSSKITIKTHFVDNIEYMSPEQSGQIGGTDFSSDYYSLGVVFYEMLTGRLPLKADAAAEWAELHATKVPERPDTIDAKIPSVLSDIVMKLLAKSARDRYQTAYGLLKDLLECKRQWLKSGKIEPFKLGMHDISTRFKLPTKLIGRERETAVLKQAFDRARSGSAELVFVTGTAGIGKTMLINETVKALVADKGYYGYGKYDQLRQNVPYAAISSALGIVIRQLMAESKEKLEEWKKDILCSLGNAGALITEIVPDLEMIIGRQPAVEIPQSKEAINRIMMVFENFLKVFSNRNTPLVMFLDDLQWADPASLRLLEFLYKDTKLKYLLIIAAYRDNEIDANHPIQNIIDKKEKTEIPVTQIKLFPFDIKEVTGFLQETLHSRREKTEKLAKILYRKTYGNPFFLSQMLVSICNQKLITFNIKKGRWEWNEESINSFPIPDDVLVLILSRLNNLTKAQLDILKLASCIGNSFDTKTLSMVSNRREAEIAALLIPAIMEGLVLQLIEGDHKPLSTGTEVQNTTYEFLHDRVRQAVYSLFTESEKKTAHLKVGRLILQLGMGEDLNDKILAAMDHMNRAIDLITDQQECLKLAEYNLLAGRKAKASAAYDTAVNCIKAGIKLLPVNAWETYYDLCFDLYVEYAQNEFLIGNTSEAKELFGLIIRRAKSELDKADVLGLQILLYTGSGEYAKAVEIGIKALKGLGMVIPANPSTKDLLKELLWYKLFMSRRSIEDLYKLPEMKDPVQRKVAELLIKFILATSTGYPNLHSFAIIKAGNHTLRYGNTEMAPIGYVGYSIVEGVIFANYAAGDRLGKMAIELTERYDKTYPKCIVYFTFGAIVWHWSHHAKDGIEYLQKAVKYAVEAGDVLINGYSRTVLLENRYIIGTPLIDILDEINNCKNYMQKVKHDNLNLNVGIYSRVVSILTSDIGFHNGKADEDKSVFRDTRDKASLGAYYYTQMQINYFAGNFREALAEAEKVKDCTASIQGFLLSAECNFYQSLIITAIYEDIPASQRRRLSRILRDNQKQMKKWAISCPENFLHKFQLVEAERMRIRRNKRQAEELYEKAIQAAYESGYQQNEAIACELAAKFYIAEGKQRVAKIYMNDALKLYSQWGASAKVKEIRQRYPELLDDILTDNEQLEKDGERDIKNEILRTLITDKETASSLELSILQKTIRDISGEFKSNPESILEAAMKSVFATKGFLIIEKGDELFIEAEIDHQSNSTTVRKPIPLKQCDGKLSKGIVRYVANTRETVIINNVYQHGIFTKDPYLDRTGDVSIACLPLYLDGIPAGVLYLENKLIANVFTEERLKLLELLIGQTSYAKALEEFLYSIKSREDMSCEAPVEKLTDRELEILKLIAEGLTNNKIAKRLHISNNTVKTHIKNIYEKLHVNRRVQVVKRAKELNIL
ncbi:MAG: AAA family ATPase [Tepidanaerobacteraceae bacterium]|jgi:predicted ATPase/DNA-binding CsgD family transcriptional regulator/GAF domain-containing protein